VNTVPYPLANAGKDTTICFGTSAQLKGSSDGISFKWTPSASLSNPSILTPVASPVATTSYVLWTYDNKGCPKPGKDTVIVTTRPRIVAFAGRDTSVVIDQPLQLNASGGSSYTWSPPLYLSNSNIANPVATFNSEADEVRYKVMVYDEAKCFDSASILVRIYKTLPVVFVPTAFTPNNDGRNDLARPIAAGISKIEYFNIYNRWGQLVFTTTQNGKGWDGRINGQGQSPDTYVWVVKATDYKGLPYIQKGTITLIR
jgi:gliding motility-associated-like protein